MPFFEPPPEPPEPPIVHEHVRDPRQGAPEDVLGSHVDIRKVIGRSASAIVILSHITAYADGFEFTVVATSEKKDQRWRLITHAMYMDDGTLSERVLRVGVQFSDLEKATSLDRMYPTFELPRRGPILWQGRGQGGQAKWEQEYWVWPLPPDGDLHFVCAWPFYGIDESWLAIDAQQVLDASQRVVPLWPEAGR